MWKLLKRLESQKKLSRCMLGISCVFLILLTINCATHKSASPSLSTPPGLTSAAAKELPTDVLLPCGNGLERNKLGNCPNIPPCPKRCYLGAMGLDTKSCWNHPDYEAQLVNGTKCQWTFPPGSRN